MDLSDELHPKTKNLTCRARLWPNIFLVLIVSIRCNKELYWDGTGLKEDT